MREISWGKDKIIYNCIASRNEVEKSIEQIFVEMSVTFKIFLKTLLGYTMTLIKNMT